MFWVLIFIVHLTVCSCHVTEAFQSESTPQSCLNVTELLARSRDKIWSLSDYNWSRTKNHSICERTVNHLAKLSKLLSCFLTTYLYAIFDCTFLSCHVRISKWIHTLKLRECQETPCSKQARNLKFKWLKLDPNPEPSVRKRTLNNLLKLTNLFSCVLSTYLRGPFDCMFLSCHIRISEWVHTL